MVYIRCLEDENEQLKLELNALNTFNFPHTQPIHKKKPKQYAEDSTGWLDPYGYDEFENFFAQIKKMDFTETDMKEIFKNEKPPNRSSLSKFGKNSLDSHDSSVLEYEETPMIYRTADMNDPEILKSFLRICGIPYRPYDEIMTEITAYIQKRKLNNSDPKL